MAGTPNETLVVSYFGDTHYHRSHPDDVGTPVCRPDRIPGIPSMRRDAERYGQEPCPECWPAH